MTDIIIVVFLILFILVLIGLFTYLYLKSKNDNNDDEEPKFTDKETRLLNEAKKYDTDVNSSVNSKVDQVKSDIDTRYNEMGGNFYKDVYGEIKDRVSKDPNYTKDTPVFDFIKQQTDDNLSQLSSLKISYDDISQKMGNFAVAQNELIIGNSDDADKRIKIINDVETNTNLKICNNNEPKTCYKMYVDANNDMRISKETSSGNNSDGRIILGNDALAIDSSSTNAGVYHKNTFFKITDLSDKSTHVGYTPTPVHNNVWLTNYNAIRMQMTKPQQKKMFEMSNSATYIPITIIDKSTLTVDGTTQASPSGELQLRIGTTDYIVYPYSKHLQPVIVDNPTSTRTSTLYRTSTTNFGSDDSTSDVVAGPLLMTQNKQINHSGQTYLVNYVAMN